MENLFVAFFFYIYFLQDIDQFKCFDVNIFSDFCLMVQLYNSMYKVYSVIKYIFRVGVFSYFHIDWIAIQMAVMQQLSVHQ